MSESLLAHASQEDAVRYLQEIDAEAETTSESPASSPFQATRGPFRVMRLTRPEKPKPTVPGSHLEPRTLSSDPVSWSTGNASVDREQETLPLAFDWQADEQQPFFNEAAAAMKGIQFNLPEFAPSRSALLDLGESIEEWVGIDPDETAIENQLDMSFTLPQPLVRPLSVPIMDGCLPQDAPFLLNHYLDSVISSMTPVKSSKSPWHTLFFAHAKDTLATLTLSKTPDHASLTIFYAILSVSAFNNRLSSPSQIWHSQANAYRAKALETLKLAISDASRVPKKFKYKTILMALLTMIQVSVSGLPDP